MLSIFLDKLFICLKYLKSFYESGFKQNVFSLTRYFYVLNEMNITFSTVSCKLKSYMIYLVDKYEKILWACFKVDHFILINEWIKA